MALLLATGFVAGKTRVVDEGGRATLASLLLNVAYPALIIASITRLELRALAGESAMVALVTVFMTLALYFGGLFALKWVKADNRKPIILFAISVGNVTFIALPLISHFFGEIGVYYTVLHGATQDILIWTLYYLYFSGGDLTRISVKKLASPATAALALAILMTLCGIKPSGAFDRYLTALGQLSAPLALLFVGAAMAGWEGSWMPDRQALLVGLVRVFLVPCVFFLISLLLPMQAELRWMLTIMFGAPAAIMTTIWAKQFGYDEIFAMKLVLFTTLLFFAAAGTASIFIK